MADAKVLRVLIVDDEAPARALVREYLGAHEGIEVVGECANGFEAVKAVSEQKPDLMFLDVQMPKLTGFEVLELLDPAPAVVFCTAYDEFALKAFEVHAVDYLLKPFGRDRLAEALARVRERLAASGGGATAASPATAAAPEGAAAPAPPSPAALAAAARPSGQFAERLMVRDGARVHVIPIEKLDYVEAQDDYVAIHAEGHSWLKHQTLAELEQALDPARFVRVHRSYVVNVERIARIEPYAKDSRIAILHDGRELPVSRGGYQKLRERM